ncbi:acyltransferase family protein [Paraburkholderia flava]|uniref:acyltransferase family protein n=1 Tax=Paraburkholderia flava TaxID=2547393 RepID=UPI001414D4DF|nr:acyltransferase [Paraburkholderia flava]
MKELSVSHGQYYPQLDALRGVAALMVVINHFVLLGPLAWVPKTPLRVIALGHEAVILFFALSGFVLTLQLRSRRGISYRDYLVKRICRIYLPYLVVLIATFSIVNALVIRPVNWAGGWFNAVWSGPFTGTEIVDHLLFIGQYKAGQMIPVIWSLIYEMRISLIMPLVVFCMARAPAAGCIASALAVSILGFALVPAGTASSANFEGDWAMTAHYLGIFIAGATLAIHQRAWRQWLAKGRRTEAVLAGSVVLYFVSRSTMSITSGTVGQFIFDWCVAAGSAGILCTAIASSRFAALLAMRPIAFLGTISYSLYLTHAVVLIGVIHLMPAQESMWHAIVLAAVLVIPVATVVHFVVERRTIALGQFLTGRTDTAAARARQQPF